jgi:hypothetical protein
MRKKRKKKKMYGSTNIFERIACFLRVNPGRRWKKRLVTVEGKSSEKPAGKTSLLLTITHITNLL